MRKPKTSKISPINIVFENGIEMSFTNIKVLTDYSNYSRSFWYNLFYDRRGIPKMMNVKKVIFHTPNGVKVVEKNKIVYKTPKYKIHPRLRSKNSKVLNE